MASKTKAWRPRVALAACLALSLVPLIPDDAEAQSLQKQVSPALTARLKGVMVPLLEKMNNPIPLNEVKVSIAEDPNINAGNAGGGDFLVTTGFLQRANDHQLRSIMAHEVAHADLGHVQHQELLNTGLGIGISRLLDVWNGIEELLKVGFAPFMLGWFQHGRLVDGSWGRFGPWAWLGISVETFRATAGYRKATA